MHNQFGIVRRITSVGAIIHWIEVHPMGVNILRINLQSIDCLVSVYEAGAIEAGMLVRLRKVLK